MQPPALLITALFLLLYLRHAYAATKPVQPVLHLPAYVGKGCSVNDPNINECVVRVGQPAIKQVTQGDPKYRIPKLDPLLIKELRVQQGTRQVGLALTCKDCQVFGLQNTKFIKARVDWKNRKCEYDLSLDEMKIRGKYNVSGQVLLLPIVGQGDMQMNLSKLKFQFIYDWTYRKHENGFSYVVIDNSSFPFDVGHATIHLENLFNGDKLLGGNMNRFLNENWREILKDLTPALSKAFGNLAKTTLQNMANVIPFEYMFPAKIDK